MYIFLLLFRFTTTTTTIRISLFFSDHSYPILPFATTSEDDDDGATQTQHLQVDNSCFTKAVVVVGFNEMADEMADAWVAQDSMTVG